jgi:ribonuclease BN (tRNA processing enzyme)
MMTRYALTALLLLIYHPALSAATRCGADGLVLQVLGSGGPELDDQRASSGYLIWHNGKARILIDMGAGSLLRFEQSRAALEDLDMILLTHLHVDHSNDLPALIKASYFSNRQRDLPLYGPTGNQLMPSATQFVLDLFGPNGAFHYLNSYLDGSEAYRLIPHDVKATGKERQVMIDTKNLRAEAVPVHHGPIPALAWRVDIAGKSLVFSGDMNNDYQTLSGLANKADLLVADHAIPEGAGRIARNLHMPPSVIGQIATQARVKQVVLSHRMNRTLGREQDSTAYIRRTYAGPLSFADDLQCFRP